MTGITSLDEAIRRVPEWRSQQVSVVEELRGLTNRSFRVRSGSSDYVLRLDGELAHAYGLDRDCELKILHSAVADGLAPEVVHAGEGLLVTRWVDGEPWSASDLNNQRLESIASLLRRVHALPRCGHLLSPDQTADRYLQSIRGPETVIDKARECRAVIESPPPPADPCLCHNDVNAANIIGPAPVLIDWEYACDNDPLFDLACLIEYHKLTEEGATTLLSAYAGGATPELSERLEVQRRLYAALQFLWFAARDSVAGAS